jgi:hypothetical protein
MVHPSSRFVPPKAEMKRGLLVAVIIIMICVSGVVGYLIYAQAVHSAQPSNSSTTFGPISAALYSNLTSVSDDTLSTIGYQQTGTTAPTQLPPPQTALLSGGKPEVLYIGDEWCPNCAAERWSLVIALSKFGTFSGLQYMISGPDDGNISTLTFRNMTFTSAYISFVAVEHQDRNYHNIKSTTGEEQSLWDDYTSGQDGTPFVDIYGQYLLTGTQYNFGALSKMSWTQIGSQLNNPQSYVAKLIDGSANQLIGAICSSLQSRNWPEPKSLCAQSFANVSYTGGGLEADYFGNLLKVGSWNWQLSVSAREYCSFSREKIQFGNKI